MVQSLAQFHSWLRVRGPAQAAAAIGLLVGLAGLSRLLLGPMFGANHAYAFFFPAVLLVAYFYGRGAAASAALLSAAAGFALFIAPYSDPLLTYRALAPILFFLVNSAVAVFLITGLQQALRQVVDAQRRAEALAGNHAELFRELNERSGHHLRLVSAVLAMQGRGETDPRISDALVQASQRSALLARTHREMSGHTDREIDLVPFAAYLTRATLLSRGLPPDRISVEGGEILLPLEELTTVAVALLECLKQLLDRKGGQSYRLQFLGGEAQTTIRVADVDPATGAEFARLSEVYLLRAVVDEAGGAMAIVADEGRAAVEVVFPRHAPGFRSAARTGALH